MHVIHDTIDIHEAKTHFSELVNAATEGREILIAQASKPVAKLVPSKPKVQFGVLKGKMTLAVFDAPFPDEIIDLFEEK